jgi:hypothetical protein
VLKEMAWHSSVLAADQQPFVYKQNSRGFSIVVESWQKSEDIHILRFNARYVLK